MWNTTASLATLSGNGTVQNTKHWGRLQTLTIAAGSFPGTIADSGVTFGGPGTGDTGINLVKEGTATSPSLGKTPIPEAPPSLAAR